MSGSIDKSANWLSLYGSGHNDIGHLNLSANSINALRLRCESPLTHQRSLSGNIFLNSYAVFLDINNGIPLSSLELK